jgi:hypothetical protein
LIKELEDLVLKEGASTIFIDNLDDLLGENFELSHHEKSVFVEQLDALVQKYGFRLILIVTVSKKTEWRGGDRVRSGKTGPVACRLK